MGEVRIALNDPVALEDLEPFFDGWYWTPSTDARRALLTNSSVVATARTANGQLVGLATALTDGAFFGYLSFLEVLADYQGRGLGRQLVEQIAAHLGHLYDIAAITDAEVVPFYEKTGFRPIPGVHLRRHPATD